MSSLRERFAAADSSKTVVPMADIDALLLDAGLLTPMHLAQQAALLEVIGGTPAEEQNVDISKRVLVSTAARWLCYDDSTTDESGNTVGIAFPERLLPDLLLWDASLGYEDLDEVNTPFIHPDTGPWLLEGDLGWLAYAAGVPYFEYVDSKPDRDQLATLLGFVTTAAGLRVQAVLRAHP